MSIQAPPLRSFAAPKVRGRPVGSISIRRLGGLGTRPAGQEQFTYPYRLGDWDGIAGRPEQHRRLVLFVHGYANNTRRATKSYSEMLAHLDAMHEIPTRRIGDVFLFYWPGDLPLPAINQLSYPYQVRRANTAGERLAQLLSWCATEGSTEQVVLVAHSLGSRVVMEALRRLRQLRDQSTRDHPVAVPMILGVVLMAGAVPEYECQDQSLFQRLEPTPGFPNEVILFSHRDAVLRWTFPLGQAARLDQVLRPVLQRAVGRAGGPAGRWLSSHRFDMQTFGHSHYWKGQRSADAVAGMFGRPVRHPEQEHLLVEWTAEIDRALAEPNEIRETAIG